jgi:chromatin assembly factor 1 subunit A
MAPPRVPLNPIPLVNGTSLPLQSALDLLAKQPQTAHSKASKPTTNSKPMPQEIMNDFKLAIEGSDLTKTGLIEVLKKKFPSVTKNTVVDTLAMVAKREGKKEAEKKWVLL